MIMKPELPTFWLTNFSKRNVSLADLNLTIKAFSSINLLDTRHYSYTLEQLLKSEAEGSIFKKQSLVKRRQIAPTVIKMNVPFIKETFIPSRERSIFVIKEENYDELNVSDEDFAKDNADLMAAEETKK